MQRYIRVLAALVGASTLGLALSPAIAQKKGGTLRVYNSTNPPSASIHEESTIATDMPFMAVYSNLVMFDTKQEKNSADNIVPDLAVSWAWNDSKTELTMKLREGVKWHDGKPFTAKDVQCTWHRMNGKEPNVYRRLPRKIWWENLVEVTTNGDYEATFHLSKPQASFLSMLASGLTPVYPCHVEAKDMRTKPIGTGPFKFVEFRRNESIKLVRNPDYYKPGLPYLDGIEWRIVPNRATRVLAFATGDFDLTFTADITPAIRKDLAQQAPNAICKTVSTNVPTNVLVNATKPPFDSPKLRRAAALAIDRQALIDIVSQGENSIAVNMMSDGNWAMPPDMLKKLPGYGSVPEQQAEARKIMEELGYGPNKRLKVKVSTRDFNSYKDPAVVLVDQLNKVYFDAELDIVESSVWYARLSRIDYSIALNLSGVGIDDPDAVLKGAYACKSEANYTKYCNQEVEKLLDAQEKEFDTEKRKKIVWDIEKILAEDVARPIIYHGKGSTCWQPQFKGYVLQSNSIYNNWRFDDAWLER
ncbi:MAG: ABC transporter substrate-binding protein [Hyphomicrobiaceae bacterium]